MNGDEIGVNSASNGSYKAIWSARIADIRSNCFYSEGKLESSMNTEIETTLKIDFGKLGSFNFNFTLIFHKALFDWWI